MSNRQEKEHEITPGTPEFDKMVFKLNEPVNAENVTTFNFGKEQLHEIQQGIYVMPAYIADDFNLFFMASQLIEKDWVISFSEATMENGTDVTDLSEPITTGKGLNLLGVHSPETANKILKYFNTLVNANRGEWRLIK